MPAPDHVLKDFFELLRVQESVARGMMILTSVWRFSPSIDTGDIYSIYIYSIYIQYIYSIYIYTVFLNYSDSSLTLPLWPFGFLILKEAQPTTHSRNKRFNFLAKSQERSETASSIWDSRCLENISSIWVNFREIIPHSWPQDSGE